MKTIKIKFVGKYDSFQPIESIVYRCLIKNGYDVQIVDDPDYIICDIFGDRYFEYCKYPQVRIMDTGENYIPDFNLVDYSICRYPIQFQDRNFFLPGCFFLVDRWLALPEKDRNYSMDFLKEKPYFANFIAGHESEHNIRGDFFKKLCTYKRVESPGSYLNNMPKGETVAWNNQSKVDFQRKCKFTLCFESTSHNGFITEKITDAFYSDTIPVYYGDPAVTKIFNKNAFINCSDYESFDAVIEKIKELDQDDEKYLAMLRQPILVDPGYPKRLEEELDKFICAIFDQPLEKAYRRCQVYHPKTYNDYLYQSGAPTLLQNVKKQIKALLRKG